MTEKNLCKGKKGTVLAGLCIVALAAAGILGISQREVQAKIIYWEIGTEEDSEVESTSSDTIAAADEAECIAQRTVENPYVIEESGTDGDGWKEEYGKHIQENFRYLEKFGVVYDKEEEAFFYKDKKIRWLIDELTGEDTQKCCHNEKGIIDVYTVRTDGELEGVRVADEEEFEEKTVRTETAVLVEAPSDQQKKGE